MTVCESLRACPIWLSQAWQFSAFPSAPFNPPPLQAGPLAARTRIALATPEAEVSRSLSVSSPFRFLTILVPASNSFVRVVVSECRRSQGGRRWRPACFANLSRHQSSRAKSSKPDALSSVIVQSHTHARLSCNISPDIACASGVEAEECVGISACLVLAKATTRSSVILTPCMPRPLP